MNVGKKPLSTRTTVQIALVVIALIGLVGYYAIEAADYARMGFVLLRDVKAEMVAAANEAAREEGE